MATADKTIRFVVSSSAAAIPPNTVQLVGTGSEQTAGARPSGFSAAQWTSTVFYQYSGGCFVPGWGTHGCWAGVGHGGHAAGTNNNVDACIFDFADYSFKWLPNTNGVTHAPTMWTEAQTDGAPLYALSGTSGQVPAPHHSYGIDVGINSDVFSPYRQYGLESNAAGAGTWRCRLNYATQDCTWSLVENGGARSAWGGWVNSDQDWMRSHVDSVRGLVWACPPTLVQSPAIASIDPVSGSSWTSGAMTGNPGDSAQQTGSIRGIPIMDSGRSRIWYIGANDVLYYLTLGNPGASVPWQIAAGATGFANARSGTSGATTTVRWHEYPVADGGDGCFYTHSHAGQRILKRFNPSTLVIDTVTITQGDAMPSWNTANPGHYSNFFYVPSRRCFALVPGNNQRVALIRP